MMKSIPITFVFGQSGAGITSALNMLQDLGYLVMDNFPIHLISQLFDDTTKLQPHKYRGFAFGLHSHLATDIHHFQIMITQLPSYLRLDIIFLTCSPEVLEQRFSVTRRPHPWLSQRSSIKEAIAYEHQLMTPFKTRAHQIIDTTHLSPLMLGKIIHERCKSDTLTTSMLLILTSFGFKRHLSLPGDYVFDVRFLKNPYFDPQLKPLNGLDPKIQQFVKSDPQYLTVVEPMKKLLQQVIPQCQAEQRAYLRVAVGCTGGIHRSVTVIEDLKAHFESDHTLPAKIGIHTHHMSLFTPV